MSGEAEGRNTMFSLKVIQRAGQLCIDDKESALMFGRLLFKVLCAVVIGLVMLPMLFLVTEVRAAVAPAKVTTTVLSSSENPLIAGNKTTITATIDGANGTPTGTVYFYYNGTLLSTAAVSNGEASFETTLSVGESDFTATYGGDTAFQGSFSEILKQIVNKAPTSTLLTLSP
ncbi:MAG: Ig-like domain-containing protein, partial [Alphaproteobacteria bacterium]|nr:Ig-like domain-containing protein [Alphaproteobacteria bacterium]